MLPPRLIDASPSNQIEVTQSNRAADFSIASEHDCATTHAGMLGARKSARAACVVIDDRSCKAPFAALRRARLSRRRLQTDWHRGPL